MEFNLITYSQIWIPVLIKVWILLDTTDTIICKNTILSTQKIDIIEMLLLFPEERQITLHFSPFVIKSNQKSLWSKEEEFTHQHKIPKKTTAHWYRKLSNFLYFFTTFFCAFSLPDLICFLDRSSVSFSSLI